MKTTVAMFGSSGRLLDHDRKSPDRLLQEVWDNSGNLVFQRAASLLVDDPKLFVGPGADIDHDQTRVGTECKAIVFPAANHIDSRKDLSELAAWLGKPGLPLVVLGIGTQAPDCSDETLEKLVCSFAQDPGFLQLMSLFRRADVFVGVRGDFTHRLLRRFDVEAPVLGCPSFLMNAQRDLGMQIERRLKRLKVWIRDGGQGLRLSVTAASPWSASEMQCEQNLLRWLHHFGGIYVQQSGGLEVFQAFLDRFDSPDTEIRVLAKLKYKYGDYGEPGRLSSLLHRFGQIFFDVDDWRDAIGSSDLSIGTRYHGNALAMQTSVPAIVATHDSRTQELCESTLIPTIPAHKISPQTELQEIVAGIEFDGKIYDERRMGCAATMLKALSGAGIEASARLRNLAGVSTS